MLCQQVPIFPEAKKKKNNPNDQPPFPNAIHTPGTVTSRSHGPHIFLETSPGVKTPSPDLCRFVGFFVHLLESVLAIVVLVVPYFMPLWRTSALTAKAPHMAPRQLCPQAASVELEPNKKRVENTYHGNPMTVVTSVQRNLTNLDTTM